MAGGWGAAGRMRPVVLVGVDRSEFSGRAARWAAELGVAGRPVLRLVHVSPDRPGRTPPWLSELAAGLGPPADVRAETAVAPDVGAELARRSGAADLVVVGSYGEGSGAGVATGSTAATLLERARCPLAVVRGPDRGQPPPDRGDVVVGVDGSPESSAALELAADLASGWGARLLAVHTWREQADELGHGLSRVPESWDELAAEGAALVSSALEPVRADHPELDVASRVVGDSPLRALLDLGPAARLIVVGSRGVRPRPRMGVGSTSLALVDFAPCPVLVVRPRATDHRDLAVVNGSVGDAGEAR